jgi:glycosyltransferase involved in cell wall biosynthesis
VNSLPPFVSIIVSFHNESSYLRSCVKSLLDLDYPKESYEIILINSGSTDGSQETIEETVRAEGSRITILQDDDRGPAAGRNLGIKAAKGEILAITDPDCVPDRNWLAYHVRHYKNEKVGAVQGKTVTDWDNLCHPVRVAPVLFPYTTCNMSYRAKALREVGPFDEQFKNKEDIELALRLLEAGWLIENEPRALVYHPVKKLGIKGIIHRGLRHIYDPLLYKKHPKTASPFFRMKKIGPLAITSEFGYVSCLSSLSLATILLMPSHLHLGLLSALLTSTLILKAYFELRRIMPQKMHVSVVFLAFVVEASRLYGSLKFRKFLL